MGTPERAQAWAPAGGHVFESTDINDLGNVVGESSTTATGDDRGFFWTPTTPNGTVGTMTALGTLGGQSSALAINASNQVVGYSYLKGDRVQHACRFLSSGAAQDLNSLKAAGATGLELLRANAINRGGSIVGDFKTSRAPAPSC
jgi:probable HAF family extracellular repeat protein